MFCFRVALFIIRLGTALRATALILYYLTRFLSPPILWTEIHTTPIISGMQQTLLALAERIKELRKKAGFSQESFADHCGLHRTQMSILERGKRNPSLGTLQAVADGLDVSLSDLLKGVDAAHRKQRKR